MKNIITQFSRIFVGILFIISGLIKLNDPIGFSYKLTEYFSEPVFNMPFFVPFSLGLALFLVSLEIILGIMLLIGYKSSFTVWSLLILIVLFTFLTFYSAYFDVVKDCGCFGDALKLTPWQSFTKDLILLVFIIILFVNKHLLKPVFLNIAQNIVVMLTIFFCIILGYYVIHHLPVKDFRPFAVGNSIQKGMEIPENAIKPVTQMIFIYEVNGIKKEFSDKQLNLIPKGAKYIDRIDKVIVEGFKPPIHDFTIEKNGKDFTNEFLNEPKVIFFVLYDLEKAEIEGLQKLNSIQVLAASKGYKVIALTGSSEKIIATFKNEYDFKFEFYFCDATALKTIERANPSIIVLKNGTIMQKVHHLDSDDLIL